MSGEPIGRYRLRATMTPLHGAPVNWNARAITWKGSDRRFHLRRLVLWTRAEVRRLPSAKRGSSPTYRLSLWLFALVDDRHRTYTATVSVLRRLLNTQADVEARQAWSDTNRYWKAREQQRWSPANAPTEDQS